MDPILTLWGNIDFFKKSKSGPFQGLQGSIVEFKLNTPKFITGSYFGIVAEILDF